MQYNSSISQSFMVMSFVAAGLLLSVQLMDDSPSRDRTSRDRTSHVHPSHAQIQNRPSIQPSKSQSSVPNTMAIATPSHRQAQEQEATDTVSRHPPSLPWPWPLRMLLAPIQGVTEQIARSPHNPASSHNPASPTHPPIHKQVQTITKKEGTQAMSLLPVSGNSVNQSKDNPTVFPFNSKDDARLNHQQTEHTLTEHTLTEHTLTEHTLAEHTLTEQSGANGRRIPHTLANKPQVSSLPNPPHSTQIDPTQQDSTNQAITTHPSTEQSKRQQERTTARLVVDLSDRQLLFHQQGKAVKTYPIAVGKAGWETPLGEFTVTDKDPSPLWQHPLTGDLVPAGSDSPLGSRWIGFWSDGIHQIGFHGTNQSQSIGQAISHGCIRLHDVDIQELYAQVALGTPVIVQP